MIASHQSYFSFIYFLFSCFFFIYFYFRTLLLSRSLEQNATRWCRRSCARTLCMYSVYSRCLRIHVRIIIYYFNNNVLHECSWLVVLRRCRWRRRRRIIFVLHYVLRVSIPTSLALRTSRANTNTIAKQNKKFVRSDDGVSGARRLWLRIRVVPTGEIVGNAERRQWAPAVKT